MFIRLFSKRLILIPRSSINTLSLVEKCWQCQRSINRFECPANCPCEKHIVLPVHSEIDYFRLFNLSPSFEIDTKQLTKDFRNNMKLLHPDLFTNKSDIEKQYSQDQSSLFNEAYKTLLSPLARAHYLLKLENITLEDSPIELPPDFLMRIMEINEQIVEESNDKRPFPIELAIEMRQEIDNHMKQLSIALNVMDLAKAKEILARLQYFNNINDKLIELEIEINRLEKSLS